jgi:hypothetical protein
MQFVGVFSKIFFSSKAKLIWWHHHYPWYYNENTNFLILTKRYLEKFIIKFIDELVANSEYLKQSLEKIYKRKSKILYPTIILPSVKFSYPKDTENKIVFTYSRWVKGKNVEQIFETYEFLK